MCHFALVFWAFLSLVVVESAVAESPASSQTTQKVDLLSHEATYSVELAEGEQDLSDASGEMNVKFMDVEGGWITQQNSTITMQDDNGSSIEVKTSQATWESKDGSQYRFMIRTAREGSEEVVQGVATIDPKTQEGTVTYSQPEIATVKLAKGTIFPVHHLKQTLAQANQGQYVSNAKVFDGSSETKGAVDITIMMARSTEAGELTQKLLKANKTPSWPLQIAVFSAIDQTMEPDYKINQKILESGVIEEMTLDYPKMHYRLKATLKSVKPIKGL